MGHNADLAFLSWQPPGRHDVSERPLCPITLDAIEPGFMSSHSLLFVGAEAFHSQLISCAIESITFSVAIRPVS